MDNYTCNDVVVLSFRLRIGLELEVQPTNAGTAQILTQILGNFWVVVRRLSKICEQRMKRKLKQDGDIDHRRGSITATIKKQQDPKENLPELSCLSSYGDEDLDIQQLEEIDWVLWHNQIAASCMGSGLSGHYR